MGTKKIIYCAGPDYSPEDRFQLDEIKKTLSANVFLTYIPREHVLYQNYIEHLLPDRKKQHILGRAVFACNLHHLIDVCEGVVFSLNGRVPDEGGIITAAISFIVGKPVILYKKDIRGKVSGDDNAMITGLGHGFQNTTRLEDLPKNLSRAMQEANDKGTQYKLPLNVKTAVEIGRAIQELLPKDSAIHMDLKMIDEIISMCKNSEWYKKFAI